jgi:hypothetical protein
MTDKKTFVMHSFTQIILRWLPVFVFSFLLLWASTYGWNIFKTRKVASVKPACDCSENLQKHVYVLAQDLGVRGVELGYESLLRAQDYIRQEFVRYGYVVEDQEFVAFGKPVRNIIATKKGKEKPDEIIILGAHYDSCFNPGADDNASGVAGLLETARLLAQRETKRTIRFIAFVNEEPPFFQTELMGSWVYARAAKKRGDDIRGAIVLEMLGFYSDKPFSQRYPPPLGIFYPNRANFIGLVSNFKSRHLTGSIEDSFRKNKIPAESVIFNFFSAASFSDHWAFWQEGYPAAMVTDTSFMRSNYYHSAQDTHEKLDYNMICAIVCGLKDALLTLAD